MLDMAACVLALCLLPPANHVLAMLTYMCTVELRGSVAHACVPHAVCRMLNTVSAVLCSEDAHRGKQCCKAELCVFTCDGGIYYSWASNGTVTGTPRET